MPDLILHQYELSPFSEKVRRIFAFKKLAYKSVRAPAVMPKPDVVALTGGYRKIPILQIGNHVYCDTALIAKVIERYAPTPPLYPSPLTEAVAEWFDGAVFGAIMPFVARPTRFEDAMRLLTPEELAKIGEDRAAMRTGGNKVVGYRAAKGQLAVYLERLDRAVRGDGFLFGVTPCIADFSAYHGLWLLERIAPEPLEGRTNIAAWMKRVASIVGDEPAQVSSEDALRICREAPKDYTPEEPFVDAAGITQGSTVTVRATDYGVDPIEGALVLATLNEVALRREDPRAGTVYVHFPRVGYEIIAAKT